MPPLIRETCFWIAASILALMPIALAIDFGGVLWWSQYIASLATSIVVLITAIGLVSSKTQVQIGKHVLLLPLLLWIALAWFQTISLPPSVVAWLSPASVTAYTDWVEPYVESGQAPKWFPISLSVADSRHSLAILCIVLGIAWASAIVFDSRKRLGMLLSVLALGAACVSAIGLWRRIFPDIGFLDYETHLTATSFSTFINRNNAALLLNLGLAASLGLLSWRLTALTGQEVDDPEFEFSDLLSLINDRDSMIGIASATLCVSGLLVGGSRGGVVAALVGILIAFGWVRKRRGLASLPVIASVVGLCVAILLIPTDLSLESIQRLEVFAADSTTTLLNDGRLSHWPDGLRTAYAHFPLGSGLATYGDAVHPHQQTSSSSGFAHADNLWVELVTEQGVLGALFALAILILIVRSLHRMGESADPIDLGLRITGWFALASIVTSQVFDFGLIIPANLFAIAILFPAIVARDTLAGTAQSTSPTRWDTRWDDDQRSENHRRTLFATSRQHWLSMAIAIVTGLLLIPAVTRLGVDAKTDSLLRALNAEFKWTRTDGTGLSSWIDQLSRDIQDNPSPDTFESLCELSFHQARLLDVAEQAPKTASDAVLLYEQTAPHQRRLRWDRTSNNKTVNPTDSPTKQDSRASLELYTQALDYSSRAICLRPLAQTPRPFQVYLDFVHQDAKRTRIGLEHLAVVYAQEPPTLAKIGSLAADSGEFSIAAKIWKSAIIAQPSLTTPILSEATKKGIKDLNDILPGTSASARLATAFLLSNPKWFSDNQSLNSTGEAVPNLAPSNAQQLLQDSLNRIDCGNCASLTERANCEQLAGDAAYQLREFSEAFSHYQEAVRYDSMNISLRVKLITRLKENGQRRLALDEARKARAVFKEDPRFDQMIDAMAAENLQSLDNP